MKHLTAILTLTLTLNFLPEAGTSLLRAQERQAREAAQNKILSDDELIDSLLLEIVFEDEEIMALLTGTGNYHFLYARSRMESQSYFAGRDIGIEQKNYAASLSYFHSKGFSAGLGSIWYSGFDPNYYATILSLGYLGKIAGNREWRYRAGYDRYFFNLPDSLGDPSFKNAISAGLTFDKDYLGTSLQVALLAGQEYAGQLNWDVFSDLRLVELGKYDELKFQPRLSFYFGTEIVAYYELSGFGTEEQFTLLEESSFGLLNASLKLPLVIDLKGFDLELAYHLNFPRSMLSTEELPMTSYFSVSLGYLLGPL